MSVIAVVDVGGSSIKFAIWDGRQLKRYGKVQTPETLSNFYQVIQAKIHQIQRQTTVSGVAFSIPGAVNKQTGQIEGKSAISYIHFFDIHAALESKLNLPVTMENDANCAALAELTDGAGQGVNNLLFVIIGTGVGGAVILDRHIWHGHHLMGGEFGYMLVDDHHILSDFGSPVKVARHYTQRVNNGQHYDGQQVFALADTGDPIATQEVNRFYHVLGQALFNLQYSFDPERIVIGGAVSNNPRLIKRLNNEVERCRKASKIGLMVPELVACRYTDAANLRGAATDFLTTYPNALAPA